ncbi:indole-3-glycerol phosphate synthase [Rhodothermaceae bacterium RA]|nr:indole-3-glycerol phosphate synthase [Rhodothermaceae bacterium RA]
MTILDAILNDTRALVAHRKATIPARQLMDRPFFHSPTLPLAPALRHDPIAVIAEIKRASPSRGLIRADFPVRELANQYKHGGARAISVLTEPIHFQGSLDNLALVRQTVDLPLLRKDFIIDPYQLIEARAYGADAVLLIAAALEASRLYDLHAAATELGLSCLVEVYDPRELERIDFDQVQILGVNNRDLRTFEVDVEHSLRTFAMAPDHVVRVSESGLGESADTLAHLRRHGIDAVLIGEAFMRAPHPGAALADLMEQTRRRLDQPLRLVG